VVLYDEVARVLMRAVCAWAGVPLAESDVARRTDDMHGMIEGPAAIGPRHWRGLLARARAERWMGQLVERERIGLMPVPADSALRVISEHRDAQGRLLPRRIAAVELLNVLRPTVAIDRFIVFAALALHEHPEWRERVRAGEEVTENFVQEVRRYYPFFPLSAARVRRSFDWQGHHFPRAGRCCSTSTAPTAIRSWPGQPSTGALRGYPGTHSAWSRRAAGAGPGTAAPTVGHHRADEAGGDQPDLGDALRRTDAGPDGQPAPHASAADERPGDLERPANGLNPAGQSSEPPPGGRAQRHPPPDGPVHEQVDRGDQDDRGGHDDELTGGTQQAQADDQGGGTGRRVRRVEQDQHCGGDRERPGRGDDTR
jgi:hypothetical protein